MKTARQLVGKSESPEVGKSGRLENGTKHLIIQIASGCKVGTWIE